VPWPLTVALAIVGGVVLVLAMPVRLTVTGHGTRFRVRVQALLGLVSKELEGHGRPTKPKPAPKPRRRAEPGRAARRFWAIARSRGLWPRVQRFLARIWASLRIRELSGVARVGLVDPAETGQLWAVLGPLALLLARRFPDFALQPSFADEPLDVDLHARLVVVPLEILGVTLAFLLGPTMLRTAAAAWRTP
jgi:hypothetical protein